MNFSAFTAFQNNAPAETHWKEYTKLQKSLLSTLKDWNYVAGDDTRDLTDKVEIQWRTELKNCPTGFKHTANTAKKVCNTRTIIGTIYKCITNEIPESSVTFIYIVLPNLLECYNTIAIISTSYKCITNEIQQSSVTFIYTVLPNLLECFKQQVMKSEPIELLLLIRIHRWLQKCSKWPEQPI